jgi:hypothetical protein
MEEKSVVVVVVVVVIVVVVGRAARFFPLPSSIAHYHRRLPSSDAVPSSKDDRIYRTPVAKRRARLKNFMTKKTK